LKINGQKLSSINTKTLKFPRPDAEPVIITLAAISNPNLFDEVIPDPEPPMIIAAGGEKVTDFNDKEYIKKSEEKASLYPYWLIITALQATEGLEFEKVKLDDPSTWKEIDDEIFESGFNLGERSEILVWVNRLNGIDQDYVDEARKNFT